MKLWEGLSQELNFNTMVSQRGILNVFHSDPQRNAMARGATPCVSPASMPSSRPRRGARRSALADFDNARFPSGAR